MNYRISQGDRYFSVTEQTGNFRAGQQRVTVGGLHGRCYTALRQITERSTGQGTGEVVRQTIYGVSLVGQEAKMKANHGLANALNCAIIGGDISGPVEWAADGSEKVEARRFADALIAIFDHMAAA